MLYDLVPAEIYAFMLIFVRLGTVMVTLPAFGETYISPRVRLIFSLLMAAVLAPILGPGLPPIPPSLAVLMLLILTEVLIGAFIGLIFRFMITALATAGAIIAFTTGFAAAQMFNPALQGMGTLHAVFYSLLGILLIFATNLHHAMLLGVVDSYILMPPAGDMYLGDMVNVMSRKVADSFVLGFQLATPFILFTMLFNALLGLLARLMPQMQVFFIAQPLQLLLGIALIMIGLSGTMMWFLEKFTESILLFRV